MNKNRRKKKQAFISKTISKSHENRPNVWQDNSILNKISEIGSEIPFISVPVCNVEREVDKNNKIYSKLLQDNHKHNIQLPFKPLQSSSETIIIEDIDDVAVYEPTRSNDNDIVINNVRNNLTQCDDEQIKIYNRNNNSPSRLMNSQSDCEIVCDNTDILPINNSFLDTQKPLDIRDSPIEISLNTEEADNSVLIIEDENTNSSHTDAVIDLVDDDEFIVLDETFTSTPMNDSVVDLSSDTDENHKLPVSWRKLKNLLRKGRKQHMKKMQNAKNLKISESNMCQLSSPQRNTMLRRIFIDGSNVAYM